jgi:chromosome segregation ATPase
LLGRKFNQNNDKHTQRRSSYDPNPVPEIIAAGLMNGLTTTHHDQERKMNIEELKAQISDLEIRDTELTKREAELSNRIAGVEAEIMRVSRLVRRFDKIDDFARMTHDLDVAEAAYNAFLRYCYERSSLEKQLDGLYDDYRSLEAEIDNIGEKLDELNWTLSEEGVA